MRKILFPLILTIVLVVVGCSGSTTTRLLNDADKLVFTDPDSAISLLASIDTERCSKGQKARCALLEAKAYSKAHKSYPGYERLASAVNYYHGDDDSLEMQTNFYYGIALRECNRPVDAIIHLSAAFESAKKHGDNFYAGLISRYMFFSYQDLYMSDSAAAWAPREKEYFLKTKLPEYISWADATIVESLLNEGKYQECLDSISKIDSAFMNGNRSFRHQILKFKADALANSGKVQETIDCYTNLLDEDASLNSKEWNRLAEMLILAGRADDARSCLDNGMQLAENITDSISYWKVSTLLSQERGDFKNALRYSELWGNALAEDNDKDIRNPKITIFSNYLENKVIKREQEIHRKRVWLYTLGGISLILIIMIIVIIRLYRLKQRAERNEILYLQTIIDHLNSELKKYDIVNLQQLPNNQTEPADFKIPDKEILIRYVELIDNVCEFYGLRLRSNTVGRQIKFTDNIKDFIKSIEDGSMLDQLIEYSNRYDGNWATKLKEASPSITTKEIGGLLCEHLNLSNTSTTLILNYKMDSVYNVRSIAKRKLKASGLSQAEINQLLTPLR